MAAFLALVIGATTGCATSPNPGGSAGAQSGGDDAAKAALAAMTSGRFDDAVRVYTRALTASPRSPHDAAMLYQGRGDAYDRVGEYDKAIADYDAAIRFKGDFAQAYDGRGNAYSDKGQRDRAIADYDMAIRLKPDFAEAYKDRGDTYDDKGEHEKAVADYDEAIRLKPDLIPAYTRRGHARFYLGRFAAAASDFERVLAANRSDSYIVLWLHLARAYAGQDNARELARDAEKLDRASWPGPIVDLYLGRTTAEKVRAAAAATSDPQKRRERNCEAAFFAGAHSVLRRERGEAERLFRLAVASCPANFVEASAAGVELKRLTR